MQGSKKLRIAMIPSIICLFAMLLAGCGSTSTAQNHSKAPADKQIYRSVTVGAGLNDIGTFDPALVTDLYSGIVIGDIFTGLVTLDDHEVIQPELAQSWTVSSDHLTWTFKLKSGLTFSDGTPLTSHDVAYSIDRAFQPATKSPTAGYYMRYILDSDKLGAGSIKTIIGDSLITPDDQTIEIKLNAPIPFFLDTLTYPSSYVVEKSLVDAYPTTWTQHLQDGKGGGSGPFVLKSYTPSKEIDLVPNPNYYGPKPQLKEIQYPFYKDPDDSRADYLAGRIDDSTVPLANYTDDKGRPDFVNYPTLSTNYYAMDYNTKPFDNLKVRQAFEIAINKQKITQQIWKGSFVPTNHIIPQGMYGYDANLKGPDGTTNLTGNKSLAKQLFDEGIKEDGFSSASQIPASALTLTYASAGNPATKAEAAELQQEWHDALGVNVQLEDIDFNTLIQGVSSGSKNPYKFYSGPAWIADYPDPEDWTTLQFDKGQSQNGMNFGQNNSSLAAAQQQLQQKLEAADVMPGDTAAERQTRLQAYNSIEQQLVDQVAWLPMEQQTNSFLRKPCVQNLARNPQGLFPPQEWGSVYISNDSCANVSMS